jgi:small subunit ribosomal protein S18
MLEEFEKRRKKICRFCEQKLLNIDYKDERVLRRFLSDRGRILPRRITGNCASHQRKMTQALKRARHLALLPFTAETYR